MAETPTKRRRTDQREQLKPDAEGVFEPIFDFDGVVNETCRRQLKNIDISNDIININCADKGNANKRFIIMGGGPGGLMTAILLKRKLDRKTKVTVFEARRSYNRTQILALSRYTLELFKRILGKDADEVLPSIFGKDGEGCYTYWPMNDAKGKCFENIDSVQIDSVQMGYVFGSLSTCILEQILLAMATSLDVEIIIPELDVNTFDIKFEPIEGQRRVIVEEVNKIDGTVYGDLVLIEEANENLIIIGAEGKHSKVRSNLFSYNIDDPDEFSKYLNQPTYDQMIHNKRLYPPFHDKSYAMIFSYIPSNHTTTSGDEFSKAKYYENNNRANALKTLLVERYETWTPALDPSVLLWRGFRSPTRNYYVGLTIPKKLYYILENVQNTSSSRPKRVVVENIENDNLKEVVQLLIKSAAEFYGMEDISKEENNINKINFQVFKVEISKSDKVYRKIPDGPDLFLLGDANFNVHFFTGTGVNSAFLQADKLTDLFCQNPTSSIPLYSVNNVEANLAKMESFDDWQTFSDTLFERLQRNNRLFRFNFEDDEKGEYKYKGTREFHELYNFYDNKNGPKFQNLIKTLEKREDTDDTDLQRIKTELKEKSDEQRDEDALIAELEEDSDSEEEADVWWCNKKKTSDNERACLESDYEDDDEEWDEVEIDDYMDGFTDRRDCLRECGTTKLLMGDSSDSSNSSSDSSSE